MTKFFFIFFIIFFVVSNFSYALKDRLMVIGYVGIAEIKTDKGWKKLKIDDLVETNSKIRVKGKEDFVDLLLPDGTISRVIGGTEIIAFELMKKEKSVAKGKASFQVVERTGVAGVRGGVTIKKPLSKQETEKFRVKGYIGLCLAFMENEWKDVVYNMELSSTNSVKIATTNDMLRIELPDGKVTNLYGPLEITLQQLTVTNQIQSNN